MIRPLALATLCALGCGVGVPPVDDPYAPDPIQPLTPHPTLYNDLGAAKPDTQIRGLIALPIRDDAGLTKRIQDIYDPTTPSFRHYLTAEEVSNQYAPLPSEVEAITNWLKGNGFAIAFLATNRLLIQYTTTVANFDHIFGSAIHIYISISDTTSRDALLGPSKEMARPNALMSHGAYVLTLDGLAPIGMLSPDLPHEPDPLPGDDGVTPAQIREHYGLEALTSRGKGQKIGVLAGRGFRVVDAQNFWKTFGITREDPEVVVVAEAPTSLTTESSLDVQWSGALAPEAHLVVYEAPDQSDTALLFTWNEAVGRNVVSVFSTSFSRRETSMTNTVAQQYDVSARLAAAQGITMLAASGDSNAVDAPASCPYVTAVGGTNLGHDGVETVWDRAGAGASSIFAAPTWATAQFGKKRITPDIALNAGTYYWTINASSKWDRRGGTSYASPIFAALIGAVNGERALSGLPAVGFLNTTLYRNTTVQSSFRDITVGTTGVESAKPGWDNATGWGSPHASQLVNAIP